jgi:predicted transcriptional regulator
MSDKSNNSGGGGGCGGTPYTTRKNSQVKAEERRLRVASLYIRGKSQVEIAADVGVSQSTVCNDLNEVRRLWKASAMVDFDAKKEEQLAKIDEVEKKAWEAWERSCEDAEVRHRRREFIRVEERAQDQGPGQGRRGA